MRKTQRAGIVFAGLAVLALMIGVAPAMGSQDQQRQQPKQPQPIQGDLVKVDTEAKTLTVKVTDGTEVEFTYNDNTEISGAKGAAGLATMKESRVTVHFTETPQTKAKLASRIIVEPRK